MRRVQKIHVILNLLETVFAGMGIIWFFFFRNSKTSAIEFASVISLLIFFSLAINSLSNIYFLKNGAHLEFEKERISIFRFLIRFFAALSTIVLLLFTIMTVASAIFTSFKNSNDNFVFYLIILIVFALLSLLVLVNQIKLRKMDKRIFEAERNKLVNSLGKTYE